MTLSKRALLALVIFPFTMQNPLHALDHEPGAPTLTKLVVALKPNKNPEAMLAERKALETHLSGALGLPVEVITPLSNAVIVEGFLSGSIDVGYLSAFEFLIAREQGAARMLLAGEVEGSTNYSSIWLVKKESPYKSIDDLAGKPVAFASKTSTSGRLVPVSDLVKRGLLAKRSEPDQYFGRGNVFYGTGYVSAVERVLAGEAEAAAVSDYVYEKDKHLNAEQKAALRVLQEQRPVPTHVIAVRGKLSAEDVKIIENALLAMNRNFH